jgi:signal transduction histidine kinase
MVSVDKDRIKEAILNIITNANQATKNGEITIKAYQKEKEAVIEISDNGCGISEEDLKNVFTPFFTTRPHGTGLGLAITHRIIKEHNGRIDVKSVCGGPGERGFTTFVIHLPLE